MCCVFGGADSRELRVFIVHNVFITYVFPCRDVVLYVLESHKSRLGSLLS